MKARIIKIGNSKGIRIPKPISEQCNLQGDVEMEVENRQLTIRASTKPRDNWESYFRVMSESNGDKLSIGEFEPSTWDETEWEW